MRQILTYSELVMVEPSSLTPELRDQLEEQATHALLVAAGLRTGLQSPSDEQEVYEILEELTEIDNRLSVIYSLIPRLATPTYRGE